jgi:hypothetical protein
MNLLLEIGALGIGIRFRLAPPGRYGPLHKQPPSYLREQYKYKCAASTTLASPNPYVCMLVAAHAIASVSNGCVLKRSLSRSLHHVWYSKLRTTTDTHHSCSPHRSRSSAATAACATTQTTQDSCYCCFSYPRRCLRRSPRRSPRRRAAAAASVVAESMLKTPLPAPPPTPVQPGFERSTSARLFRISGLENQWKQRTGSKAGGIGISASVRSSLIP